MSLELKPSEGPSEKVSLQRRTWEASCRAGLPSPVSFVSWCRRQKPGVFTLPIFVIVAEPGVGLGSVKAGRQIESIGVGAVGCDGEGATVGRKQAAWGPVGTEGLGWLRRAVDCIVRQVTVIPHLTPYCDVVSLKVDTAFLSPTCSRKKNIYKSQL